MRLEGKVAVVTGGASGIGEATCMRLAQEGARVAVLDLDDEGAGLTARLAGGIAVHADVSDGRAVELALERVERDLGPVGVWVNNAGIPANAEQINERVERQIADMAAGRPISTPLDALTELQDDEWRRMIAVHLDGTFYGTRAAARSMTARATGTIINVASICGMEGCTGFPHYSAAKAGILGFTRAVAKELIQQGVRVNAVAPGFIDTPMVAAAMTETLRAATIMRTPAGRLGLPHEIAAAVSFLASDDASFLVGETISPNGGTVTI